jgi:DNA-binding CsgD family transcriptional regulator
MRYSGLFSALGLDARILIPRTAAAETVLYSNDMLSPMSPSLVGIIGQIYEAAEDRQVWHAVVHKLGCEAGSTVNVLSLENVDSTASWSVVNDGVDPKAIRDYAEHYHCINFILDRVKPLLKTRPLMSSSDICSDDELVNTEYYQGFMRPLGVFYLAGGLILSTPASHGIVTLCRARHCGPWTTEEMDALGMLMPHFRRAARLSTHLTQLRAERDDLLNRFGTGVILIGQNGKAQFINHAAEEILSRKDGLEIKRDGSLVAMESGQTARIAQLIAAARQTADGKGAAGAGSFSLIRPSLGRPLSILVAPLMSSRNCFLSERPTVALFITDPDAEIQTDPQHLRTLFRLTPTESKVATALMQGASLEAVVEELGMRIQTARVHLKRIFSKTETGRQGELIRLLLTSIASLRSVEVS